MSTLWGLMTSQTDSSYVSSRSVAATACVVTLVVAYRLFLTAQATGNYEGMWFSLVHTVMVALGVILALRPSPKNAR